MLISRMVLHIRTWDRDGAEVTLRPYSRAPTQAQRNKRRNVVDFVNSDPSFADSAQNIFELASRRAVEKSVDINLDEQRLSYSSMDDSKDSVKSHQGRDVSVILISPKQSNTAFNNGSLPRAGTRFQARGLSSHPISHNNSYSAAGSFRGVTVETEVVMTSDDHELPPSAYHRRTHDLVAVDEALDGRSISANSYEVHHQYLGRHSDRVATELTDHPEETFARDGMNHA